LKRQSGNCLAVSGGTEIFHQKKSSFVFRRRTRVLRVWIDM